VNELHPEITRWKKASLQDYVGLDAIGRRRCKRLNHHFNLNYNNLEHVGRLVLSPACYRKDEVSFLGSDIDNRNLKVHLMGPTTV
jgi:hypothetical protein